MNFLLIYRQEAALNFLHELAVKRGVMFSPELAWWRGGWRYVGTCKKKCMEFFWFNSRVENLIL